MFSILLAMISPISMTHVAHQSMHKDDEPVKNTEDAVNESWRKELCVKSLGNKALVKKFSAKCYEIVQIVENIQQCFTQDATQPLSLSNGPLYRYKDMSPEEIRRAKTIFKEYKSPIYYDNVYEMYNELRTKTVLYDNSNLSQHTSKMTGLQNILKSDYLYNSICIEYGKILYNLRILVEFTQVLLSLRKSTFEWFDKLNKKIYLCRVLNNEFIYRLYRAFHENKPCPFDIDELRRLACVQERLVLEYEDEDNHWSKYNISLENYNSIYGELYRTLLADLPSNMDSYREQIVILAMQ